MTIYFSGGTHSKAIIIAKDGTIIGRSEGLGTNHWVCIRCTAHASHATLLNLKKKKILN